MFTRQHFEAIAQVIRELPPTPGQVLVAERFADRLEQTNGNFKREQFLAACDRGHGFQTTKGEK
jgi:hypothetical protein